MGQLSSLPMTLQCSKNFDVGVLSKFSPAETKYCRKSTVLFHECSQTGWDCTSNGFLEGGGADGKAVGNWAVTALYSEIDGAMVSGLNSFEQSITGRNILATSMAAFFKTTSWLSKSMPLWP